MPGGDFFIVMLLLWMFVGRGVDGERVTGVLHGRVELRGCYGHHADVYMVEWNKYSAKDSTKKTLYLFRKPNDTEYSDPSQNISFNFENMSLILAHLTPEDEGIYEEKSSFTNGTVKHFNITLTFLTATSITVNITSPGSLTLTCEIKGEFQLLRWFRNGHPLPADQRFSFSENNKTMRVSHLNSSDCGTYTCQVSNENGKSETQVSINEPVYKEPTRFQEEAATPTADPLVVVYQDFIKPKDSHQSEDFGYSTIADVLENTQHSNTT